MSQANGSSRGREADLLTRAMSELTQSLTDFRQASNSTLFLSSRPSQEDEVNCETASVAQQEQGTADSLHESPENNDEVGATLDHAQINQLIAQYHQQAALGANSELDPDTPVVSVADVVVAPTSTANWTIVSVGSTVESQFEQSYASS